MKTSEVLSKAADHLEKVGLHKGYFFNLGPEGFDYENAPCCTLGALRYVSGYQAALDGDWAECDRTYADYEPATEALLKHLNVPTIAVWNDKDERTQDEVVAALREAAKKVNY